MLHCRSVVVGRSISRGPLRAGTSVIYRGVQPTHEYGTRPFLRWVRSQGRSPHASGKAKNTFSPVGIPLFGAPQAPGNKSNPSEVGKSLGGWPPTFVGRSRHICNSHESVEYYSVCVGMCVLTRILRKKTKY